MPAQIELLRKIKEAGRPVVALSFGSPYFIRHLPQVEAYLCLYRNTPETQELAAMALGGEICLSGRLPVSIPGLYQRGEGLDLEKINKQEER